MKHKEKKQISQESFAPKDIFKYQITIFYNNTVNNILNSDYWITHVKNNYLYDESYMSMNKKYPAHKKNYLCSFCIAKYYII